VPTTLPDAKSSTSNDLGLKRRASGANDATLNQADETPLLPVV
jgi:hypothetical protein